VRRTVAEPAVEALDEPVLLRLARRDTMPCDATLLLPAQHRVRPAQPPEMARRLIDRATTVLPF
jgi:hypothetical protein